MKALHTVAYLLVFVGALNWGLIGGMGLNMVASLGLPNGMENIVYVLVGVSAVYLALTHKEYCGMCGDGKKGKKK